MFRKFFVAVPIVVLAVGGSTACATKKYVRTSVGEVNEKVDSQGRAIEVSAMVASCSAPRSPVANSGSRRSSSMCCAAVKMTVFTPTPSASDPTAMSANPGLRASMRSA